MDNHFHVIWDYNNNRLPPEILEEFRRFVRYYPNSSVTKIINIVLDNSLTTRSRLEGIMHNEIKKWAKKTKNTTSSSYTWY